MTRSLNIVHALKAQLKQSGMTYKNLAVKLDLSESAVKQMFASENFSLRRLDDICDAIGIDLSELIDIAAQREQRIERLSVDLEKDLVSDLRLLVVAYCLVNHWRVEDIFTRYKIGESEMITILARLDRMKLIELLPGNKVKLLIASSFKWNENGPIEKYFRTQVQEEFFRGNFNVDGALRLIKNGDITRKAQKQIIERLEAVGNLFDDICNEEKKEPISNRQGTTMILAIRNWEFTAFTQLERGS